MRFPRGRNFEGIAGMAAVSLADYAGLDGDQVRDLGMAVREACAGLAGRFFVGACQGVVVQIRAYPGALRVIAYGDGVRALGEEATVPLDAHDAQMSLSVLRGLMDRVTLVEHQRHGICLAMTKRRRRDRR